MIQLVESEAVLTQEGHVLFKQFIRTDEHPQGSWLDTDMSANPTPDAEGRTSESTFLLGLAILGKTTVDDIRTRLIERETIYLVKPPEPSLSSGSSTPKA